MAYDIWGLLCDYGHISYKQTIKKQANMDILVAKLIFGELLWPDIYILWNFVKLWIFEIRPIFEVLGSILKRYIKPMKCQKIVFAVYFGYHDNKLATNRVSNSSGMFFYMMCLSIKNIFSLPVCKEIVKIL